MLSYKCIILTIVASFLIIGVRSIVNGRSVKGHKRFMVYLLRSPNQREEANYSAWLCGGAIIHPYHILTSAACLFDVNRAYVISGYSQYVNADLMFQDECVKRKRKRVVHMCMPRRFSTNKNKFYGVDDRWNWGDIAVARVESSFDYYDMSYYKYCTYPPAPIKVNLDRRNIANDTPILTYGWGSRHYIRPDGVTFDMNENQLRYSSARIMSAKNCYENYIREKQKRLFPHCTKFFACAMYPLTMDENGVIENYKGVVDTINKQTLRTMNLNYPYDYADENPNILRNYSKNWEIAAVGGFCQNDHGGPLVGYVGGHEVILGVSTMYFVNKRLECRGPYLYTTARCSGKMIQCVLYPMRFRRTLNCDGTAEQRKVYEKNITWPEDEPW